MPPLHFAALYSVAVFVIAALMQAWTGGTGDIILVANVIAFIAAVWIVVWYQAHTDWKKNVIGRSTMGIKLVFVLFAVAGLLRRALEIAPVYQNAELYLWVDRIGDAMIAGTWVLTATVLVQRLDALKTLQAWRESQEDCECPHFESVFPDPRPGQSEDSRP